MKTLGKQFVVGILCVCASVGALGQDRQEVEKTIIATTGEQLVGRLSAPVEVLEGRAGRVRIDIINPSGNRTALNPGFPVRMELDAEGLVDVQTREAAGWSDCVLTAGGDGQSAEMNCETDAAIAPGRRAALELDVYWEQPGRVVAATWENIGLGIDVVEAAGPRLEVGIEPWLIQERDRSPDVVETFQEVDFMVTLGYFGSSAECAQEPVKSVVLKDVLPPEFVLAGRSAEVDNQVAPFEGAEVVKDVPCLVRGSAAARDSGNLARLHIWGEFQKQGIYWIEGVGSTVEPQPDRQADRGRYRVVTMRTETDRWCVAEVDLEIKNRAPERVGVGEEFRYTLSAHNNGPVAASDVLIVMTLPDGVAFRTFGELSGATCAIEDGMVECGIETLEVGEELAIEVEVTAEALRERAQACAAISSEEFDPVRSGNFSCKTTTLGASGATVRTGSQGGAT